MTQRIMDPEKRAPPASERDADSMIADAPGTRRATPVWDQARSKSPPCITALSRGLNGDDATAIRAEAA
jgi:hypothetical protein